MDELVEMIERKVLRKTWEIGAKYEVEIIGRSKEHVYVDCGDKKEGLIKLEEFIDRMGNINVVEGEKIEAYYVGTESGFRLFTTFRQGFSTLDLKKIRDAYDEGHPIEGKVLAPKKGGFEIEIGSIKCFCPRSQIGDRDESEEDLIGKNLSFKVMVFEDEGKNIVLSRKALIQEEKEKKKRELKDVLKEGAEVDGRIKKIMEMGAIVDLGGIDAFLPRSEVSWTHFKDIKEILRTDAPVKAKIKEINWDTDKIVVSIKELSSDPFMDFIEKHPIGSVSQGRVVRIEPFGVFVRLEEGIDGFAHISKLSSKRRVKDPAQAFHEGQTVKVSLVDVNLKKRKISLAILEEEDLELNYPEKGELVECQVVKSGQKGVLVEVGDGILGYIPDSELKFTGEKAKSKNYVSGTTLRAVVLEIEREKGRIILSEKKVEEFEEKEEYLKYKEKLEREMSSFGTLGELIRDRLK
ncbi:MAG: S1 RNA-binding domain-containing protein [Deltaproteobacteria bacterium]|nr:S1 RNA-binding domain-containing protein [Deltaproteobacteria bacterium]